MEHEHYLDYDQHSMFEVLKNFDKQLYHAIKIGDHLDEPKFENEIREILIAGMGGSAIGGDLLRSYLESVPETKHIRINVIRNYNLPEYVDEHTSVIASSYSGNTEETLSAFSQALEKTRNIICVTSGGQLAKLGEKNDLQVIKMPGGFQPRCALGYSFMILLFIVTKLKILDGKTEFDLSRALEEALRIIQTRAEQYAVKNHDNPAYNLAKEIKGKIPVIYSSNETFDAVNLRWRGQFHENAKSLAFGNLLLEMNHNEINSWDMPAELLHDFQIIFLRDANDHDRIKLRFDAIKKILEDQGLDVLTFAGEGNFLITRIMDLLYLSDWTSFYLAELYDKDPMAIPAISKLKDILSKK